MALGVESIFGLYCALSGARAGGDNQGVRAALYAQQVLHSLMRQAVSIVRASLGRVVAGRSGSWVAMACAALLCLAVAGCGQKSGLYLPDEDSESEQRP